MPSLEIVKYEFKYRNYPDEEFNEEIEFGSGKEAIEYFNKKGYGMENWTIIICLEYGIEKSISLNIFNKLYDLETKES